MTKTLKRPEVLSPAGTLEKLKVAVQYGADAVFIGGQAYGLRSRAGNFTFEQMEEGVQFAAKYGAKVYVAANMVMHEGNEAGAGEWFRKLRDIGIAAVIVSDPALIMIAATEAPGLEIHLSTQASATNYETLEFWKELGLTRVVLAREVSMEELAEIRKRTDVEIEAFVHGAMCISYSGRCTLSNHMSMREEEITSHFFQTLQKHGYRIGKSQQTIYARLAKEKIAHYLEVEKGHAILGLTQISYLEDGTAFEYVKSQYVGERFEFYLENN